MKGIKTLTLTLLTSSILFGTASAATGDLSAGALWTTSDYLLEGQSVTVAASAINNSGADLLGTVRITANGESIGGDQPISALSGSTDEIFVVWYPSSYGTYNLTMTVYPWDASGDNAGNNVLTTSVYVEQDTDRDGIPNSSDPDNDNDGVINEDDQFPFDASESIDTDGDGTGDNADQDDDNDGVNDIDDAFPTDADRSRDLDQDGLADEEDDDIDGDGLLNEEELELELDPTKADTDDDGILDGTDLFPTDGTEWQDTDGDGTGDNSDSDIDGDGIENSMDADPFNLAPAANLINDSYITGLTNPVSFDAEGAEDLDGEIINYIWTFEDGTVLEGEKVEKSFSEAGFFSANLLVIDDTGQTASTDVSVRAYNYQFIALTLLGTLLLISLAFYTIYRYNRRASEEKEVVSEKKAPTKSKPKSTTEKKTTPKKKTSTAKKKSTSTVKKKTTPKKTTKTSKK